MSQKQHITDVLMVGATGSIGRLAVEAAQRHGLRPRALVRDVRRAERLLPGVELVRGDLEDPASLRNAVGGADAIVLTHGSGGDPETRRRVDYGGVRNLLQALDGARPRVALMTSIYATRSDIPGNSPGSGAPSAFCGPAACPTPSSDPAGSTRPAPPSGASSWSRAARPTAGSPATRSPRRSSEAC